MSEYKSKFRPDEKIRVSDINQEKARLGKVEISVFSLSQTEESEQETEQAENKVEKLESVEHSLSEQEVINFYKECKVEKVEIDGESFEVPFTCEKDDHYFDNPERVSEMDYKLHQDYEIDPRLKEYQDRLIEYQKKLGRNLVNGQVTGVASYDIKNNILGVRRIGYYDAFSTNNSGMDVRFSSLLERDIRFDGVDHENIRSVESSDGNLRSFHESSLANVLGVGGVLITRDSHLVLPQRRKDLGVSSLGGKFGLSASGNVEWSMKALEELGIQKYMGQKMEKEADEELGLKGKMNISEMMLKNMRYYVETELGLDADTECQITPVAFTRDLVRGGLPQMFYILQTKLSAREMPDRIIGATESKKEYSKVSIFPTGGEAVKNILGNKDPNFMFNQEIRANLALLARTKEGKNFLDIK